MVNLVVRSTSLPIADRFSPMINGERPRYLAISRTP
jgi:hypothetical protein